jgi:crossover junction endodeoxyribonuclease RusA
VVIALRPTDDFGVMAFRMVVYGLAETQGNKSAFVPPHPPVIKNGRCRGGRAVMREGSSSDAYDRWKAWRERIMLESRYALKGRPPVDDACCVIATFYLPRPESLPKRVRYPHTGKDLDKLARAALDGITGTFLTNDARVVDLLKFKRFAVQHDPCMVLAVFTQ